MKNKLSLEIGELAPKFTLPAHNGKEVAIEDFKGKRNLVIFFYPKDNTPG